MRGDVSAWLAAAIADARSRGLPELEPLLEALAKSLHSLRDADAQFGHPAAPVPVPDDDPSA